MIYGKNQKVKLTGYQKKISVKPGLKTNICGV
jgi:hypothetical protein